MPSAAILAKRRSRHESRLTDTAEVLRVTDTTRTAGGGRVGTASVVASYPCRVVQGTTAQAGNQASGGRPAELEDCRIILPHSADVRITDTLRVNELLYRVLWSDQGYTNAVVLNVGCKRTV